MEPRQFLVLAGQIPKVSLEVLDLDHYHPLVGAIRNVLSTELAEITLAQLFDGLPLVHTVFDMRGHLITVDHPLMEHDKLCDGAMDRAKKFRDLIDPAVFRFDAPVMQKYQNAPPGSREFSMRLVELVAAAIHQIGVLLYQSGSKSHSEDEIHAVVSYEKEDEPITLEDGRRIPSGLKYIPPRPTLFYHINYMDHDQYLHGLADVAGYWAEDRILGGVVVFDRGESLTECNDIYFHSGRKRSTFRVWKLLPSQYDDLVAFLLSQDRSRPSPFPIQPSNANRDRHDPWDAIALHHIFRDLWERKIPSTKPDNGRDVISTADYPEAEDMFQKIQAAVVAAPVPREGDTHTSRSLSVPLMRMKDIMTWRIRSLAGHDAGKSDRAAGDAATSQESVSSHHDQEDSVRDPSPPKTPPSPSVALPVTEHQKLAAADGTLREEGHDVEVYSPDGTEGDVWSKDDRTVQ